MRGIRQHYALFKLTRARKLIWVASSPLSETHNFLFYSIWFHYIFLFSLPFPFFVSSSNSSFIRLYVYPIFRYSVFFVCKRKGILPFYAQPKKKWNHPTNQRSNFRVSYDRNFYYDSADSIEHNEWKLYMAASNLSDIDFDYHKNRLLRLLLFGFCFILFLLLFLCATVSYDCYIAHMCGCVCVAAATATVLFDYRWSFSFQNIMFHCFPFAQVRVCVCAVCVFSIILFFIYFFCCCCIFTQHFFFFFRCSFVFQMKMCKT